MRLVTFIPPDGQPRAGALLGAGLIDLAAAAPLVIEEATGLRWDLLSLLQGDQEQVSIEMAADIVAALTQMLGGEPDLAGFPTDLDDPTYGAGEDLDLEGDLGGSLSIGGAAMIYPLSQVRLLAPLPRPASLRLGATFEEHAIAVASLRGGALASAWYRGPAFAFANHGAIYGPDATIPMPVAEALDYGLGLACVIGRAARDLAPAEASAVIAGYLILNSWCAHDYEEDELALGLGQAKSPDFATSIGPWLVTPDEVELYTADDGRLSLTMTARVNGRECSRANAGIQYYPFGELIARASRDATLVPGDVIGSGPVGGGSLLEQSGGFGPWLVSGDSVELEITGLGTLRNTIA
jgi:fumarylacetoacetate (FAA) hydrolase